MAWTDRIRGAAYTSPSGNRYTFAYEDVSHSRSKKTTEFEFPDVNGTYVQESGSSGKSFPLQCIFWGDDCDIQAAVFEDALFERGVGKLEHPMYGTVDVVPTGSITRRDDLKSASNQVIVDVTFMSTIGLIYPSSQADPASQVFNAVSDFNDAHAVEYAKNISFGSALSKASFRGVYLSLFNRALSRLRWISGKDPLTQSKFNVIYDSITRGIGTLIDDPETLALQTAKLIQTPAEAISAPIASRLNTYATLAGGVTQLGVADLPISFDTQTTFAYSYVTGAILSTVYNDFTTRPSAIGAAAFVLDLFHSVNTWKDKNLQWLYILDEGSAYQQLQKAVALTAGYLVEISFTVKQERKIVLDRARTIIDLTAEVYGSVRDEDLDFFIASNDLTGSEILELPRGREIVYYV